MGWDKTGERDKLNELHQVSHHLLKHLKLDEHPHTTGLETPFQDADFHYHHLQFGFRPGGKQDTQEECSWVRASALSLSLCLIWGRLCRSPALSAFPRAGRWLNIKAAFASWHCAAMRWHERSVQQTFSAEDLQPPLKPSKGVKERGEHGFLVGK